MTPGVSSSVMVSVAVGWGGIDGVAIVAGRPTTTGGNSSSTTVRLPSSRLLLTTVTSTVAVATFLANDTLRDTGVKSVPGTAVPGVAVNRTVAGKASAPVRVTVIVALPAFSLTV